MVEEVGYTTLTLFQGKQDSPISNGRHVLLSVCGSEETADVITQFGRIKRGRSMIPQLKQY